MAYWCKASKELSDDELRHVAMTLHCTVDYIAKVVDEPRWDYNIHKESLTDEEMSVLRIVGLEVLVSAEKQKQLHENYRRSQEEFRRSNASFPPSARGR